MLQYYNIISGKSVNKRVITREYLRAPTSDLSLPDDPLLLIPYLIFWLPSIGILLVCSYAKINMFPFSAIFLKLN